MRRVLVVDDEPLVLMGLGRALRREGLQVQEAGSAEEALLCLDGDSCQICFLDIRLPGMSGLDALPLIRKQHPGTKVVVMTADPVSDEEMSSIRSLSDHFVEKPFDIEEIRSILKASLNS